MGYINIESIRIGVQIFRLCTYFDLTGKGRACCSSGRLFPSLFSNRLLASSNWVVGLGGVSSGIDGSWTIGCEGITWLFPLPPEPASQGNGVMAPRSADADRFSRLGFLLILKQTNPKKKLVNISINEIIYIQK